MTDSNKIPNRLNNGKSPYLLQDAYNPVNWYPWGDGAFAKMFRICFVCYYCIFGLTMVEFK